MIYIVLDLEWNQGKSPGKGSDFPTEIIEIGATKLNNDLKPIGHFHRIVCPIVHKKLLSHTDLLSPLTEEDLKKGHPFKEAFTDFMKWCKKDGDFLFATWGSCDLFELQRNMAFHKIKNSFSRPFYYIDIQHLFSLSMEQTNTSPFSLEKAVDSLGIPKNHAFHSAKNDAEYTAMIMQVIPKEFIERFPAVDLFKYPLYQKQEVYLVYPDYSYYVTRAYRTKEALKKSPKLMPLSCPICSKTATPLTSWFSASQKADYILGKCRKHGYLRAKRILRTPEEKHFFFTISTRLISKEDKDRIIAALKAKEKK